MAKTKIEWADRVWNPITGCSPVSEGCTHCYAKRMAFRLQGRYGYPRGWASGDPEGNPFAVTFHPERLEEPLHWKKPSRIFVCSMGDLFHEDVKDEWLRRIIFEMMRSPQEHAFLILTKRPQRMAQFIEWYEQHGIWGGPRPDFLHDFPRIWLGVSVEDQKTADERIPILLQIPPAHRWVSVEPMLGPIDLKLMGPGAMSNLKSCYGEGIHWVVAGGETGPGARPLHPDWVRSLRDQCQEARVPFFFKGWGAFIPNEVVCAHPGTDPLMIKTKLKFRPIIDGREWREFPERGQWWRKWQTHGGTPYDAGSSPAHWSHKEVLCKEIESFNIVPTALPGIR